MNTQIFNNWQEAITHLYRKLESIERAIQSYAANIQDAHFRISSVWNNVIQAEEAIEKIEDSLLMRNLQAKEWLNIKELCDYLPDKPAMATVYGWVGHKQIPFRKSGKKLRFLRSEIDKWLLNGNVEKV